MGGQYHRNIQLVMDNFKTHAASAFYETFEPEEAKRLWVDNPEQADPPPPVKIRKDFPYDWKMLYAIPADVDPLVV